MAAASFPRHRRHRRVRGSRKGHRAPPLSSRATRILPVGELQLNASISPMHLHLSEWSGPGEALRPRNRFRLEKVNAVRALAPRAANAPYLTYWRNVINLAFHVMTPFV